MKKINELAQASDRKFSLSEDEICRMIDAADNIRDRLIVELLAFTGCRRGELIRIKVLHIDVLNNLIFIPTLKRRCDPYSVLRAAPIFNSRLKQDLITYLTLWRTKYGLGDGDRLLQQEQCRSKDGLSGVRVNQIVAMIAEKAGVKSPNPKKKHLNPHLFRHSFIRAARRRGLDFQVIKEIVGHKSIATTFDMYGTPSYEEIISETQEKMSDFAKSEGA